MAQTLSFSPLSLDLPSSRMSVDFSNFAAPLPRHTSSHRTNKPVPQLPQHHTIPRRPLPRPLPLPEVKEEPAAVARLPPRDSPRQWLWNRPSTRTSDRDDLSSLTLSRANSNASTASSESSVSTAASSIFSNVYSTSTARTSQTSLQYTRTLDPCVKERHKKSRLSTLPLSLLEHIMSYTLCLPLTVSIGPQNSENRHMQYRYHRAGLDYIDIQLILKHPIFVVSHQMRDVALDVFYRKCDFVVDLQQIYHTKVASTVNDNLKKQQKFWMQDPPKMVQDTLRNLSRLHLRLPVPSCENSGHRGRDEEDWMDGSDGKGGGSWKIKSLKKEQNDATGVRLCVEAILVLVTASPSSAPDDRGRSSTFTSKPDGLRKRSLSRLHSRSRSRSRQASSRSTSRASDRSGDGNGKRELKRMDIVLVKRSPYVTVLSETITLIKTLRSTPVSGFTTYSFELEAQKVLWATKYRKRWRGFEPDGERLLKDLQGLSIADRPIEPILTPTSFKFVNVSKQGKLELRDHDVPAPIVLEAPQHDYDRSSDSVPDATSSKLSKALPWIRMKTPKRKDSFTLMMEGDVGLPRFTGNNPPSVDELKRIAEDIKNGLY